MTFLTALTKWFRGGKQAKRVPARRPQTFRPALEPLESREVRSVTVSSGGLVLPHVEVEAIYYGDYWQTRPNANNWTGMYLLGRDVRQLAVARNADGHLEVFAIGSKDGNLYHAWQTQPNGNNWTGMYLLGRDVSQVVVGSNANGCLDVFVIGSRDGKLYHSSQTRPNGNNWTGMYWLGSDVTQIAVDLSAGEQDVFVIGSQNNHLYHKWQTGPNGTWSNAMHLLG